MVKTHLQVEDLIGPEHEHKTLGEFLVEHRALQEAVNTRQALENQESLRRHEQVTQGL